MPYRPERSLLPRLSGHWNPEPRGPLTYLWANRRTRTFGCLQRLSNIVAIYPCSDRDSLAGLLCTFLLGILRSYLIGIPLIYDAWRPLQPEESVLMAINCR